VRADLRSAHVGGAGRPQSLACRVWRDTARAGDKKGKPYSGGRGADRFGSNLAQGVRNVRAPPIKRHRLEHDIARLGSLWNEGLRRFGGPFLAGKAFTAVDAFYAPVAFRIQSYRLPLDAPAAAYAEHLLGIGAMREWYAAALKETLRDAPHEDGVLRLGTVLEDLRAT